MLNKLCKKCRQLAESSNLFLSRQRAQEMFESVCSQVRAFGFKIPKECLLNYHRKGIAGLKEFTNALGYCEACMVHIPAFDLSQACPCMTRVRSQVMLHELGHVIMYAYWYDLDETLAKQAFGGIRGCSATDRQNEADCVTRYASSNIDEDLADTFTYYILHGGCLPAEWATSSLIKMKWEVIDRLRRKMQAA